MQKPFSDQQTRTLLNACKEFEDKYVSGIPSGSLTEFLKKTRDETLSEAERLRLLAIHLESNFWGDIFDWIEISKIYDLAQNIEPQNTLIYYSRGITTFYFMENAISDDELDSAKFFYSQSRIYYKKSLKLNRFPELCFAIGLLNYVYIRNDRYLRKAQSWFKKTLELNPRSAEARLYLGHCFQDRRSWPQALESYLKVYPEDLLKFYPSQEWRVWKLREQIAYCMFQSGNRKDSISRFESLFNDILHIPKNVISAGDPIVNLNESKELIEGALRSTLGSLFARVLKHLQYY